MADPAWWVSALVACTVSSLARLALSGHLDELGRYVADGPLVAFLTIAGYWRFRLQTPWAHAVGLGLCAGLAFITIGCLKGRL